jgi:hypothetical protein
VQEHAAGGGILAGPDCPEVYFLAGKQNPTPVLFDFFEEQRVREQRLLRLADDPRIKVLVVNTDPAFSGSYPGQWYEGMTQPFEHVEDVEYFEVWWRK